MLARYFRRLPLNLSQKYLLGVAAGILASLVAFAGLFLLMYEQQLQANQVRAGHQFGQLLRLALQQPLASGQDDEVQAMIRHLGGVPGISHVLIADASGRIRYATDPQEIGRNPLREQRPDCLVCHRLPPEARPESRFVTAPQGTEVLRSIVPIARFQCDDCPHSPDPLLHRGMVVVDQDAALLRGQARDTTLLLMGSGAMVLLITLAGGWWFMRNMVLVPVRKLNVASQDLGRGDLDTRVDIAGHDELSRLGHTFNEMAGHLQHAMHEIEAREAFQQALIDAIPDGIRVIDSQYRVVAANRSYARQAGRPLGDTLTLPCHASSHGRDAPCPPTLVTCPVHELAQRDRALRYIDIHRPSDGGELDVEVYAAPMQIETASGEQRFIVESIRDLAEEVHYSHEQKLADIGQLAAGVAHEIRNPLSSLQMALSQLSEGDIPEERRKDYLELVSREIDRCIDVNDRLLRLSALPPSHSELVDVNAAAEETLSLLNFEAEQRGVSLHMRLDENRPRVIATDSEIRMAVFNLVQNAFHAAPAGKGRVRVSTVRQEDQVRILVEDDGPGVPSSKAKAIFEPFFSHRQDGSRGTGLGLAITLSLVKRHGGDIRVEDSSLGGARFVVTFSDADSAQDSET